MKDLADKWNKTASGIPSDKDPSYYAIERETLFTRNAKVCDLGGCTGIDSIYFIKQGHKVTLVDISDYALNEAVIKAEALNLRSRLFISHVDFSEGALPFKDKTFNVVYSRLALHYFPSRILSELFKDIHRILKSEGRAFITLKSPDDKDEMKYLNETAKKIEDGVFVGDGHIITRFSIEKLVEILKDANIHDYEVTPYEETLEGRKDSVKSGLSEFLLNEVQFVRQ